jgi:hypothetical protein
VQAAVEQKNILQFLACHHIRRAAESECRMSNRELYKNRPEFAHRFDKLRGGPNMSTICKLEDVTVTRNTSGSRGRSYNTPTFAWILLASLGVIDLVRGVLHTFLVQHSAVDIAGMNLTHSGQDQLMLLGSFGISNFLTGAIYLTVALKATRIVPTVLLIIPVSYLLGFIAFRLNHISPEAAFPGRTFMLAYCSVCFIAFVASMVWKRSTKSNGCRLAEENLA